MKPTIINRIRLWCHCLINFHRQYAQGRWIGFWFVDGCIACCDCKYGKES